MISSIQEKLSTKWYFTTAILVLVGALRFADLGFGEIQEWDEALYAVRAKSIVQFGDWMDQSSHSVGGLYSAAHPPVFIWLTAVGYKAFGVSNFTTRLWSAIFGCGLILVVYLLGKRLYSERTGFTAAVLLGTIPLFTFYTRQGQLDIAYLFFLTTSLYFFVAYMQVGRSTLLILSGVALGLSLATKSLAGILALPIVLSVFLLRPESANVDMRKSWAIPTIYTFIGIGIALPWYLFMEMRHLSDLGNGFFFTHVVSSVQSVAAGLGTNIKELGYFYFLNQLIVRFPLSILAFGYILVSILRFLRRTDRLPSNGFYWIGPLWFLITFLAFSTLRTKVVSYTLPMLVPLSLLSAHSLERLQSDKFDRKTSLFLLIATGMSYLWSFSDDVRVGIKDFIKSVAISNYASPTSFPLVGFLIVVAIVLLVFIILWRKETVRIFLLNYFIIAVVAISSVMLIYQVTFVREEEFVDGARELAEHVNQTDFEAILYLYTPHYTYGMNPQLAYYLNGVNCGWRKDKTFIELSRGNVDSLRILITSRLDTNQLLIIIEKNQTDRPEKSDELKIVEVTISEHYRKLLETKRYILYGQA